MAVGHLDHRPVLDLTMREFGHSFGDLTIIGSWLGAEVSNSEPCLVVVPTHPRGRFMPFVVPLSAMWRWDEQPRLVWMPIEVYSPCEFTLALDRACEGLGLLPTPANRNRIKTLIQDHLDELRAMPVRPWRHRVVGGSARVRDSEGGESQVDAVHLI